ncbi:MAG: hypothetical protein CM1200mP22_24610 [Dehalococcoidia bacterium]|nr:MAG: hypothetical protein CM1200mP22_24610 [Dehalococcoidia bacterium]
MVTITDKETQRSQGQADDTVKDVRGAKMTMQVFANSSILSTITSIQFAECAGTAPSEGVIPTIRQT